jgi:hypothetical protein
MHGHIQKAGFSCQMTTMHEGYTAKQQRSVVRFLRVKGLKARYSLRNVSCLWWGVFAVQSGSQGG